MKVSNVSVLGCTFHSIGGRGFTTTLETTHAKQDASEIVISDSVFEGCGEVRSEAIVLVKCIFKVV